MIDYTEVDARLEEYSEAFDLYMEYGEMPSSMPPDDCLAAYMREVIDNNPQIDGSDPAWVEVLKEDLISFFAVLLEQFCALQTEAMKELALIASFKGATIEKKRMMWHEVCGTIEAGYSKYEVNLPGYTDQFKTHDKDAVFSALTSDWENACMAKLEGKERQLLNRAKIRFEQISREAGTRDYEDRKKIDNYVHRYPQLKEIVDLIGRDKDSSKEEKDTVVHRFMPASVAKNSSAEEIDRVESGNNLERVLPVELSMPEDIFFKRYATRELQQFSSPGKDKPKKVEERSKDPRLTKGPIIVSIDTSGSMTGQPLRIAFSLLKQLLRMAKQQKRPCYLISFSVRAKSIDLAKPRNWRKIDNFLENSFSGGTDGEEMLAEAINTLQQGTYEMADVLIVSDFEFPVPESSTMKKITKEQSLGTRFYGLSIGHYGANEYELILDKIWEM
ncbi:MAG: hypothetical protein K2L21_03280 [Muribaculaceae bacterium]|nr:hypothetical protein [Muribaculaceae bacterium]